MLPKRLLPLLLILTTQLTSKVVIYGNMKDAKQHLTFILFSVFCIAVAFTGCSDSAGSLKYSVDYIKALPRIAYYGMNDLFVPAKDVKVIGVFGGVEEVIDINKVEIRIIHDPGFNTEKEQLVTGGRCLLETEGPKDVVITYNNLETSYRIAVGAPGTGDGYVWGDADDGSGIIINWPLNQ